MHRSLWNAPRRARLRAGILAVVAGLAGALPLAAASAPAVHADGAAPAAVGGEVSGGYVVGASDGGVYNFGARDFGSLGGTKLAQPIVGLASTVSGAGYWMVAAEGGIFSFGDAGFHGSTGHIALAKSIVGMAATPTGGGYWYVAADGGIFSFGDAEFFGSTGDVTLNKPIVGMAATPSGRGYWFVASDGGMFSFGDAQFYGSTGDVKLTRPIVDMAATPTGEGYWLIADDGGIFTFGNATFKGSTGGMKLNGRVVDLLPQGGDITAPKLHSLSFSTRSVDTSSGPVTITVRARFTDDLSGVDAPSLRILGPSKQLLSAWFTNRISGDPLDGVYEATVTVPAFAEQGTWTIDGEGAPGIQVADRARNTGWIKATTLASAGYPTTFTQTGRGDRSAPQLQSLSFSDRSFDTSSGPVTITVRARFTDDLAGVWASQTDYISGSTGSFGSPSLRIIGPSKQLLSAWFSKRVSGGPLDGVYEATVTVPGYSEPGVWTIDGESAPGIQTVDKAGNTAWLKATDLAAAGHPVTFAQTGLGDRSVPQLQGLWFSTRSVDTSTGPATVTVSARFTDDLAGVWASQTDYTSGSTGSFNSPSLRIIGPSGQLLSAWFSKRVSGGPLDGVYEATVTVPAHTEQGTWTIDGNSAPGIQPVDKAGNTAWLKATDLAAAGYPTTFEVIRTG
jgi:hypothetical protein